MPRMSTLFSPYHLGSLRLTNRIVIAPMCQYSADDGKATDWHTVHLGQLAQSGAGLLILEATAVNPEGRISPGDLGLWSEATQTALARVLTVARQHSPMPVAIQLSHAGRKASSRAPWDGGQLIPPDSGGWLPLAPSALPHATGEPPPQALDAAGLARIRQAFRARRPHEILVQDLEHARPHIAGYPGKAYERRYEDRQRQVHRKVRQFLQEVIILEIDGFYPGYGKPSEMYAEKVHQQQREPECRHRETYENKDR